MEMESEKKYHSPIKPTLAIDCLITSASASLSRFRSPPDPPGPPGSSTSAGFGRLRSCWRRFRSASVSPVASSSSLGGSFSSVASEMRLSFDSNPPCSRRGDMMNPSIEPDTRPLPLALLLSPKPVSRLSGRLRPLSRSPLFCRNRGLSPFILPFACRAHASVSSLT
jgi:hypothetical protein